MVGLYHGVRNTQKCATLTGAAWTLSYILLTNFSVEIEETVWASSLQNIAIGQNKPRVSVELRIIL